MTPWLFRTCGRRAAIFWFEPERKWEAKIKVGGHKIHIGRFPTAEEAYAAYCATKLIVHPFAPTVRGESLPDLHTFDRIRAAHRVVKESRRFGGGELELDAWDHFVAAM